VSRRARAVAVAVVAFGLGPADASGRPAEAPSERARDATAREVAAASDELARGLSGLRLPSAPAPYFTVARWIRAQVWSIAASYGGLVRDLHERQQVATVRVRVGAPERDDAGMLGADDTTVRFDPALETDPAYLRRRVWLAQDASFRHAARAYARKEGMLARLQVDVPIPDLGPPPPSRNDLSGPPPPPQVDREGLAQAARAASERFAARPEVDNGEVHVAIITDHFVTVTSEGAAFDRARTRALVAVVADMQAPDGMRVDHGRALHLATVPAADEAFERTLNELTDRVLQELVALAEAPRIDEAYDGPLLFEPEAAAQLLGVLVPSQASGTPPPLSESGRVLELEPAWQQRLGKIVMPPFVSLIDDPAADPFGGYPIDAEGFAPERLRLVDRGRLTSLLMTRTPGPVLRRSNGHARLTPALDVGTQISNLVLQAHARRRSRRALEGELLRRAREDGYDYAYVLESLRDDVLLGPPPRDSAGMMAGTGKVPLPLPARLWRIDRNGRRTLVRGAMLAPVAMRVLRRIRATGTRPVTLHLRLPVHARGPADHQLGVDAALSHTVDVTVTSPALIIDGFELLVERGEHERPPLLIHPLRQDAG